MRVLVCGGRTFDDKELIYATLDRLHKLHGFDVLIEGDAHGVDRIAGYWARRNRVDDLKFAAKWNDYGNAAGPIRNRKMLEDGRPDLVVAFPGGRGTENMVRLAKAAGVAVIEIKSEPR